MELGGHVWLRDKTLGFVGMRTRPTEVRQVVSVRAPGWPRWTRGSLATELEVIVGILGMPYCGNRGQKLADLPIERIK